MTDIFKYILFSTAMYVLFTAPSILFDNWLMKIGVSRYSKKIMIAIITFFFVFTKPLWYENFSWGLYGLMYVLGTLALHRSDLGETMKRGKWWWVPKKKKKKPVNSW